MKITDLIEELKKVALMEGDIEVTCTGSTMPDSGIDVFETTVENLEVHEHETIGKTVRLQM